MGWIETYGHGGDVLTARELFGAELLDFSANINPLGPPRRVVEALQTGLQTIVHYPDPSHRVLKQKLAGMLSVPTECLVVGNGAAECMALVLLALQPKTVGVAYPCFSEYEQLAVTFGAKVKGCFGHIENDFKPELSDLFRLFMETDLVFLGHPNNPTGVLYTKEELVQLAERAEEANTYLVIDEAFIDFLPYETRATLLPELHIYPRVIIIRSMTKFYAIPGLRLGYAVAQPHLISAIGNKQVTWSVNQLALIAGEACLEEKEYEERTIAYIQKERVYVKQTMEETLGFIVCPGQANFLFIRLPENTAAADMQWKMGQKGIMIRSCAMYPGLTQRDIRIAIRTRQENHRLIRAFQEVMEAR